MIYPASTILRYVLPKTPKQKAFGAATVIGLLVFLYQRNKKKRRDVGRVIKSGPVQGKKNVAVNKEFFRNLWKLIKIVIPSVVSTETLLILLHTSFLIARTVASVYLATMDGQIVKSLVSGNGKEFSKGIAWWLVVSIPIAFVNSMIRYLQSRLSIAFRTRLTNYVHKQYMDNELYYKLENLDCRIKNPDQCITQDVAKFSCHLAEVYSNLAKPLLDCIIYNAKLAHNVGFKGLLALTLCIHTGTYILKTFTPSFGKLIAEEQRLEGMFRFVHSRISTNAEEIAFYGGNEIEKSLLDTCYQQLVHHVSDIHFAKMAYGTLENYVVKYYWGALGFVICALPVFTPFGRPAGASDDSLSGRTKDFVTNRRLLLNTSDAFGRMMKSGKKISELAGYTARVAEMLNVFEDLKRGKYNRGEQSAQLPPPSGIVRANDSIEVENLAIVSPNGDWLVKGLTFSAPVGTHTLITGPNGCGKSSLFRVLGGLWPVQEGLVKKPISGQSSPDIFYIPQRPYLSLGTLRDQVTYPHNLTEVRRRGFHDEDLDAILDIVKLRYIVEREGGWDSVKEWKDVLSGGEKQRIAMARLFYHRPKYAILDECTSAVSIDVEGIMYNKAKELGISLITVSHRPSLWKYPCVVYHEFLLDFDGHGGWRFGKMEEVHSLEKNNGVSKLTLEEEKALLTKRIVEDQQRLKKIQSLLCE